MVAQRSGRNAKWAAREPIWAIPEVVNHTRKKSFEEWSTRAPLEVGAGRRFREQRRSGSPEPVDALSGTHFGPNLPAAPRPRHPLTPHHRRGAPAAVAAEHLTTDTTQTQDPGIRIVRLRTGCTAEIFALKNCISLIYDSDNVACAPKETHAATNTLRSAGRTLVEPEKMSQGATATTTHPMCCGPDATTAVTTWQ
jgi:hypothetical protein